MRYKQTRKFFWIEVKGFDPYRVLAESRSKARYMAYRMYRDGWTDTSFRDFLKIVRVTVAT